MRYIFKSARLGFRNWLDSDISKMAAISANPEVMRFFPDTYTKEHTAGFVHRMQEEFAEKGYCYFAVDKLDGGEFIGFIGISDQTYEADFTPCTDIGWRLAQKEWGNGFATEGAKACLDYAFCSLKLTDIKSVASAINFPSERVMIKIGMKKIGTFKHSLLRNHKRLESCVLYEVFRS